MITNRPLAGRSRWITAIAVCVSARRPGGAARRRHDAAGRGRRAAAVLAPTEQQDYVARRVSDIVAREHYRRAPLDDQLSSLILDRYLDSIDGGRSYFYASDIAEFEKLSLPARRRHQGRRRGTGVRDLPPLPAAQPRAHEVRDRAAREEAGFRRRRVLQLRPREGALAGKRGGNERIVAQARQERRAVAGDRRQAMARGGRRAAQALRARGQAHGPEQARRRVRGLHERLRAVARSALELFLGAQLRGIQHPDEPELRGHRRLAAADRRLRHGHRRHRGRPGRHQRQARRERPHHGGRRGQDRRARST